jgi:hypothetical protein
MGFEEMLLRVENAIDFKRFYFIPESVAITMVNIRKPFKAYSHVLISIAILHLIIF